MNRRLDSNTIFLLGSGPSLNKTPVEKLSNHNCLSFNRSYIAYDDWGFAPNHYMIGDRRLVSTIKGDVEEVVLKRAEVEKVIIASPYTFGQEITNWANSLKQIYGDRVVNFQGIIDNIFPSGPGKVGFTGNIGACSLNALYNMGFKRVILLGVDAHYVSRDQSVKEGKDLSHFRADYFDVNKFTEHETHGTDNEDSRTSLWKIAKESADNMDDFEMFSSTPGSVINEFLEYVPIEEWLENSPSFTKRDYNLINR